MPQQATGNPSLIKQIALAIEQSPLRAISFHTYMQLALYHSEFGYYPSDREKIGPGGDFYTSSNIGSVMAEMLAHDFVCWSDERQCPCTIVEWGAGTGKMAAQLLGEIREQFPDHYKHTTYTLIEASLHHKRLQQENLQAFRDKTAVISEEEWMRQGPHRNVIVFSNELLDAFPVHRICRERGQLMEIYVGWDAQNGSFCEKLLPLSAGPLQDALETRGIRLKEGQEAEVNLQAEAWLRKVADAMHSGRIVTIDYGDTREEIYADHRMKGTLMCYRNHAAADEPYQFVGEQDMTSHIDFTALIEAGEAYGLTEWRLRTQKRFLIDAGVLNKLQTHAISDPFHPVVRKNRAIRQLLLSDQMSELFKVLEQTKKGG